MHKESKGDPTAEEKIWNEWLRFEAWRVGLLEDEPDNSGTNAEPSDEEEVSVATQQMSHIVE